MSQNHRPAAPAINPTKKSSLFEVPTTVYKTNAPASAFMLSPARTQAPRTKRPLAEALAELDVKNALIDGEAVHVAEDGTMSFHGLQNALSNGGGDQLQYYA